MIYNFNLGIGWASSGVEYAQVYRAKLFRRLNQPAKFIFMDMFPQENIQHMTENIGFLDEEIIWLYTFFTDIKIAPVSYTLRDLEKTFTESPMKFTREGKIAKYIFPGSNNFYTVYMVNEKDDRVHRVEMVANGLLIRKDYYTYCRIYAEYYAPLDGKAHLYQRRFFNEDGTTAYEEINDNDHVLFKLPDGIFCSKEELVGEMVRRLNLTDKDMVILDRTTGIGQVILQNIKEAKVISIIHADHYNAGSTNDDYILWNNYYEYIFDQHKKVAAYITATKPQNLLMEEQFKKYYHSSPNIVTIPVGCLSSLKYPKEERKPYSLITASRLAGEKHVDWIVDAVVQAKKDIPLLSLDIYGKGGEEENLKKQIERLGCENYVHLMGQQNLEEVYQNYEAYLSGSTSEGFGLTLMEALGGGLPIIGFDVPYGNQNFITEGKNGFKIPIHDKMTSKEKVEELRKAIVRLFKEVHLEEFHQYSYERAKEYLEEEVEKKWGLLISQMV